MYCTLILKVNTVILTYCRITLEDDDEDEDLDVEPAPRRPVLVISDSLKEGLQRGISDILPHTVAQSVYVILILLLECLMLNELIRNMTCVSLVRVSSCRFFSSGAIPAWSWCCGGHQTIPSVGSERAHYINSVNNRQYLSNP